MTGFFWIWVVMCEYFFSICVLIHAHIFHKMNFVTLLTFIVPLTATTMGQNDIVVTIYPRDSEVRANQPLTMKCEATYDPDTVTVNNIEWRTYRGPITDTGKLVVKDGIAFKEYHINNVSIIIIFTWSVHFLWLPSNIFFFMSSPGWQQLPSQAKMYIYLSFKFFTTYFEIFSLGINIGLKTFQKVYTENI